MVSNPGSLDDNLSIDMAFMLSTNISYFFTLNHFLQKLITFFEISEKPQYLPILGIFYSNKKDHNFFLKVECCHFCLFFFIFQLHKKIKKIWQVISKKSVLWLRTDGKTDELMDKQKDVWSWLHGILLQDKFLPSVANLIVLMLCPNWRKCYFSTLLFFSFVMCYFFMYNKNEIGDNFIGVQ